MGNDFAEILKIYMDLDEVPKDPVAKTVVNQPAKVFWTPTLSMEPKPRTFRPSKLPYRKPRKVIKPKRTAPPKAHIPRPQSFSVFELDTQGQQALRNLLHLGALLDKQALNLIHLKKEYRRLAKAFHPDRAPHKGAQFIQLKKAETQLRTSIQQAQSARARGPNQKAS